jgi:hypothetical protein
LKKAEGKEKYRVEVPYTFAALKNLDIEVEITSACETIGENTKFQLMRELGLLLIEGT